MNALVYYFRDVLKPSCSKIMNKLKGKKMRVQNGSCSK